MTGKRAVATGSLSIRFWGVRGLIPVSGHEFRRFGGDTICFEVICGRHQFIVDAGSGLRRLGAAMATAGALDAILLLSHLHLDHVIGLTAFEPLFQPQGRVEIRAPEIVAGSLRADLDRLIGEPYFPLSLEQMPAAITCAGFAPGETLEYGDHRIQTIGLNHGVGSSGFRFDHAGKALAIVTDHEHRDDEPEPALIAFCKDADLLVYDGMWDETVDFDVHRGWGHSSWQAGLRLKARSGAGRLVSVHHAPAHTDVELAARETRLRKIDPAGFFATQNLMLII